MIPNGLIIWFVERELCFSANLINCVDICESICFVYPMSEVQQSHLGTDRGPYLNLYLGNAQFLRGCSRVS